MRDANSPLVTFLMANQTILQLVETSADKKSPATMEDDENDEKKVKKLPPIRQVLEKSFYQFVHSPLSFRHFLYVVMCWNVKAWMEWGYGVGE